MSRSTEVSKMKRLILILNLFLILNQLINCESANEPATVDKTTDQTVNKNELSDDIKSKIISIARLNDTRENLSVKWLRNAEKDQLRSDGSVMFILAKNNRPKNEHAKSTSIYVSYDYGSTFKKEDKLIFKDKNDTVQSPIINTIISSKSNSSNFFFTDIINNYIFISKDFGRTYTSVKTRYSPKNIQMHPQKTDLVLGSDDGENSDLWYSTNFGLNWINCHHNVVSLFLN